MAIASRTFNIKKTTFLKKGTKSVKYMHSKKVFRKELLHKIVLI